MLQKNRTIWAIFFANEFTYWACFCYLEDASLSSAADGTHSDTSEGSAALVLRVKNGRIASVLFAPGPRRGSSGMSTGSGDADLG